MNNEHTGVIGDRPGERVDREWKEYQNVVELFSKPTTRATSSLLRAMEQHAYAITGKLFSQHRPDVVNEALTRAWKGMGKFRGDSRFSTWFHRIVVNTSKAHGAKETLRRKREVPLGTKEVLELYCEFAQASTDTAFRTAWNVLTPDERDFMDDMLHSSHDAEVATKWGLSLSGVRGKWHRIKRKIQAALE